MIKLNLLQELIKCKKYSAKVGEVLKYFFLFFNLINHTMLQQIKK